MINISFYLLDPKSKGATQLYVTITSKQEKRLRFTTGQVFVAAYCNIRPTKGSKDLIKKGTPFTYAYTTKLSAIRDKLFLIEHELTKDGNTCKLQDIRDKYWQTTGKTEDESKLSFFAAFEQYKTASRLQWSDGFIKIQDSLVKHLQAFEKNEDIKLDLKDFDADTWTAIASYFVNTKLAGREATMTNSSINKYLKYLKQFLRYAGKKGLFPNALLLDDWKSLQTLQVYKIALKEPEIATLISLDLNDNKKLDRVRDLFLLEVFTGQRYSDVDKVLDREHYDGKAIHITQQKGGERVTIPRHTKLEAHLDTLLKKYPVGFPKISNQKFNDYLKEVGQEAGFKQKHQWVKLFGKQKITESDYRYNLLSTHTGRRTFATLAIKKGIPAELVMKVTGHRKYDQFAEYVKVDDEDLGQAFSDKF